MTSSALLVVNTNSRSGERLCASLGDLLAARGIDPLHAHCESREALPQAILDNADKIDCVVIAGGEGTLTAPGPGRRRAVCRSASFPREPPMILRARSGF